MTGGAANNMKEEPSPELEAYFEICKRIYLRLESEGRLHELIALAEERKARKTQGDLT